MGKSFTDQELAFLRQNNIQHVKFIGDVPVGVYQFMYTFALVTGYEATQWGSPYYHRFCYPKSKFLWSEVVDIAQEWDGISLPPEGWAVYKGVEGQFQPEQSAELAELLK